MSVTTKQAWIGFLILFLVALLVLAAAFYWQHITSVSFLQILVDVPARVTQGC